MEGSNTGPRSGPGRAWGPLRGRSQEINTLARMLRAWVDEAHLGVDGVRDKLTAEHFASGTVPSRATVASRLSGAALQWEFVEAVIDVCSSHVTVAQRRRDQARQVWDQAQLHPTPVPDPAGPAGQRQELARARQRIVQLQGDLAIAQEARDNSRKALADTTNLVSLLWLVIGQLQVRIDQLTRQRDSLQAQTAADAPRLARLHNALQQTQRRQDAAEQEKTAAEAGRSAAKDVAAAADEKYLALQAEVEQLRGTPAAADTSPAVVAGDDVGEAFFEDIDSALDKARAVRERAGQLTHDARADLQALERDEQEGQASEQRRREGAGRDKDQGQGADRDGVRDHDPVSGLPAAPDPLPPRDDTPHQGLNPHTLSPGSAYGALPILHFCCDKNQEGEFP
ncbi:hypothetical protein ABZ721_39875, partial [Streptomyces sp. NPDC006733]|uniref:hypothetical protein n=1 Tax=Streptomyces sp. NPDC006733 TaxID=3155460 RepID=UPI003404C82C